ncbi:MAG: hypothetical protein OEV20_06180 [Actinomycetota bacterium]|nr:hypothetical protein [Actinomycetota bacterium]MDH4016907.1 hypothetical protein [Actinomycetota bacterium]
MTTASAPAPASDPAASPRVMARTAAPLITLGATWAVRKLMMKAYESATGHPAPVVYSSEASTVAKIVWAATMAATIASIEIVVWKVLAEDDD